MSRDVTIVLKVDNQFSAPLQQFNTEIGEVSDGTTQLAGSTREADDSFGGLAAGIGTAITAYAGFRGLQAISEIVSLGQSVNVAAGTFNALAGNIGGGASALQALRDATGGIISDFDLMKSTSKLMSDGLAGSSEQLGQLAGMAVHLGESIGMSATSSIASFTRTLESGSARGLLQFGLNIDAVKARVDVLKETMSSKEAFRMAVLEQGALTLDKLGAAAHSAETPLAHLQTTWDNFKNDFSSNVTTGVNATLGILQVAAGSYPGQAEAKAKASEDARNGAADFARQNFGDMTQYLDMSGVTKASDSFVSKLMFTTAEAIKNNPNLDVSKFIADKLAQGWAAGEHVSPNDVKGYVDSFNMVYGVANAEIAANIDNQQGELRKKLYDNLLAGDSGREFTAPENFNAEKYAALLGLPDDRQASEAAQQEAAMLAKSYHDAADGISSNMTNAFGSMGFDTSVTDPSLFNQKMDPSYMKSLVPDYMEQSGADAVTADLRSAQDEFSRLQAMAKQKLIGDDQLNNAKNMVDNLSTMADQAQRAADAFKNLTLPQAFGQTNGGMKGEIGDMVIQNMKDKGYSKTAIAGMQDQLDQGSGRETSASEEMKQKIVPMISKLSAKQAAIAIANLDAFIKEATLQGMSEEQIAAMMPAAAGVDVTGHSRASTPAEIAKQQKAWEAAHKKNKQGQWVDKHGKATSFKADKTQGYNTVSGGYDLSGEMPAFMESQTGTTSSGSAAFGDVSGSMEGEGGEKSGSGGASGGKGGGMKSTIMATDFKSISKDAVLVDKSTANIETSTTKAAVAATTIATALKAIPDRKKILFDFALNDPADIIGILKNVLKGASGLDDMNRDRGVQSHSNGGGV